MVEVWGQISPNNSGGRFLAYATISHLRQCALSDTVNKRERCAISGFGRTLRKIVAVAHFRDNAAARRYPNDDAIGIWHDEMG